MAQPGWYPDPGGAPGRYRYWNGSTWSPTTSPTPGPAPAGEPPAEPRRSRTPWLVGLIVTVIVGLIVAAVALWPRPVTDPVDPIPSPSATSGDDSSPAPTSSDTGPTAGPNPGPTQNLCPTGDPTARQPHPNDGRIHGGGLSFPRQPGFDGSDQARGLTWAYDVDGQDKSVRPGWFAMFAVGALATFDGFETPEQAADAVLQCVASSKYYEGVTERNDLLAEAVTVSGHPGYRIRTEIQIQVNQTTVPGDIVEVVVVDLDSPESLAMFIGAVPIGDQALLTQLDRVRTQLRSD